MSHPIRFVARVTIEFLTPFLIGAGEREVFSDSMFVADANGLPAIPGTSLAGILRHEFKEEMANKIFGYENEKSGNETQNGHGSRLTVSWGHIHNKDNKPVEGLLSKKDMEKDHVLNQASNSMIRDHVRISHKGAAEDNGKFDERYVSAGHRFTFELTLEGVEDDQEIWDCLLRILSSRSIRIGGKTRRGFGAFKVVRMLGRTFNLSDQSDFMKFCQRPSRFDQNDETLSKISISAVDNNKNVAAQIELTPEGFWMIGGGYDKDTDMAPVKDHRIQWNGDSGSLQECFVIPASSIKGPLAHRVAYYCNAGKGRFADKDDLADKITGVNNEAVRELFGYCKDKDANSGQIGKVIIDDIYIPAKLLENNCKVVNHVAIDRFTGGALGGALFSERPIYGGGALSVCVAIVDARDISADTKKALRLALLDLVEGMLPFGSGAGRGNGVFTGEIKWLDDGEWINGNHG